ncbi:MAG: hypothetical protein WCT01_04285 [Candidatus Shapirobacteria bacterium]|jgi:hypothetical protein
MFKNLLRYPWEFLILALLLGSSLVTYFIFGSSPQIRRYLICLSGLLYWSWSLFYHWRRGDLNLSILVEYLVFALLGVVVLLSSVL